MSAQIEIEVTHATIAVFDASLAQPFNGWTEQHVLQGFSWRPGSVSFRTLAEAGPHMVEIINMEHLDALHPDAVRVIEVPFAMPSGGNIEVGSIMTTVPLSLHAGSSLLGIQFLRPTLDRCHRVLLCFANSEVPRFRVVKSDPDLSVDGPLLTSARPA
jgi:hypothetical protein